MEPPPHPPAPKQWHCSLLKCKVNSSSLKLNHFKADWLVCLSLLVHFSFPLLAHPHFQEDDLPLMRNCHQFAYGSRWAKGCKLWRRCDVAASPRSEAAAEELISPPHYFPPPRPALTSAITPLCLEMSHNDKVIPKHWHLWGAHQGGCVWKKLFWELRQRKAVSLQCVCFNRLNTFYRGKVDAVNSRWMSCDAR